MWRVVLQTLNTGLLLLLVMRLGGYLFYSRAYRLMLLSQSLYFVTTYQLSTLVTLPPISFSTREPDTLKRTTTQSGTSFNLVSYISFQFPLSIKQLISSPRHCIPGCFITWSPSLASLIFTDQLVGASPRTSLQAPKLGLMTQVQLDKLCICIYLDFIHCVAQLV